MRDTFQDRMAIGKDNAKRDRDRGGSTVRVFATTQARYAHLTPRSKWQQRVETALLSWRSTSAGCIEDVRRACYGDEWEDFK